MKDIKIKIKDSTLKNVLNYSSQKNKSPDSSINEIIDFFFNQEDLYSDFVIDESKEIWKDIPGYEDIYQASSYGRIKSIGHGYPKIISLSENSAGYHAMQLWKDKSSKRFLAHRVVAITFLPNPKNLPIVNHKNRKKKDNRLENLEWVSVTENASHVYRHSPHLKEKIKVNSRKVEIEDCITGEKKVYNSLTEAATKIKVSRGNLSSLCNNRNYVKKLKKRYTAKYIQTTTLF